MMRRQPLLIPLLALLLATRALVPQGWMPAVTAGGTHLTLCTGQGLVEATLGADGKLHRDSRHDQSHHDPCPYGALGHAADTPIPWEFSAAPAPQPQIGVASLAEQLVADLHGPRPPTRGPPSFA
jgi:hypothetical protein